MIYNRLIDYLNNQFGFWSNHSTSHALIMLTDKIKNAIDSSSYSCGIFIDLCKAFDTVNYNILFGKLENYCIRRIALDWLFISPLENRS